ncbi:hypothetical protein I4U23_004604 [Adineta vaga]|nr:hypothetical protein I4U23_004604 [Adineta vaga]
MSNNSITGDNFRTTADNAMTQMQTENIATQLEENCDAVIKNCLGMCDNKLHEVQKAIKNEKPVIS